MWWMVLGAVAMAAKPAKVQTNQVSSANPTEAIGRWVDGQITLTAYETPVTCDDLTDVSPTHHVVLRRSDDEKGWVVAQIELTGKASGLWYTAEERLVTGLEALMSGQGKVSFAPTSVELDDGSTTAISEINARWCGTPLSSMLARVDEWGDVVLHQFAPTSLQACDDGSSGDTIINFRPYVTFTEHGWSVVSVYESNNAALDDFTMGSADKRPATLAVSNGYLQATFQAIPPTEGPFGPSQRTTTVQSPVRASWCAPSAPVEIGVASPGATGAWMRVGERWFEVQGARYRQAEGLELSTLPLSCDLIENYTKDAINMTLRSRGKGVDFWSVSGNWHTPPMSWNGSSEGPLVIAPQLDGNTVTLASVLALGELDVSMEAKGTTTVVRCD